MLRISELDGAYAESEHVEILATVYGIELKIRNVFQINVSKIPNTLDIKYKLTTQTIVAKIDESYTKSALLFLKNNHY